MGTRTARVVVLFRYHSHLKKRVEVPAELDDTAGKKYAEKSVLDLLKKADPKQVEHIVSIVAYDIDKRKEEDDTGLH